MAPRPASVWLSEVWWKENTAGSKTTRVAEIGLGAAPERLTGSHQSASLDNRRETDHHLPRAVVIGRRLRSLNQPRCY